MLAKNFEVDFKKSKFPYKFAIKENLFYKGVIPSIGYYENLSKSEYDNMYTDNWSFKDETIQYLNNDLNSLYAVIVKANKKLYLDYNINITEAITISGLALRIYLKDFYNIPLINKLSMYNDIKQAYYGGMTEVYKPYGENLFYYDVNSLYPYVALQDMPGLECSLVYYYSSNKSIKELFGFFYCSIKAPTNSYIGLLPVRQSFGLDFPLGMWEGWYFSEQLKFAEENGYTIKVLYGYQFNREKDVFKNYISKIYDIKSTTKDKTQKSISKSLLNNLLGRFGINLEKPVTKLLTKKGFDTRMLISKITSYKQITDNKFLVSYIPKLDPDIIADNDLDIIKIVKKYNDNEVQSLEVSSVVISAAVTAYGRIHMNKIKLDILKNGNNIYYTDTDSIVTDKELDSSMISSKLLGKLKLEHEIAKGIFISGKIYCLIDKSGIFINRAKGIISSSLLYDDYLKLLNNEKVYTAIRKESKIFWERGFVSIDNKNIILNSDSGNKRIKIFDKNNFWIDTKPTIINNIDKSLIKYTNKKYELIPYDCILNSDNNSYKILTLYSKFKSLYFKINLKSVSRNLFFYVLLLVSLIMYYYIHFEEEDNENQ